MSSNHENFQFCYKPSNLISYLRVNDKYNPNKNPLVKTHDISNKKDFSSEKFQFSCF